MSNSLAQQFTLLSQALQSSKLYWQDAAFHAENLPWMKSNPALANAVLALNWQKIDQYAADQSSLLSFIRPYLPLVAKLHQHAQLQPLATYTSPAINPRLTAGVPGRKLQQIQQFSDCINDSDKPILEWCAGKSHLGFYLNRLFKKPVTALEWDVALVEQANQYAQQHQLKLKSLQVDVLQAQAEHFLQSEQQLVALHACGELHETMLHLAVQKQPSSISLAPCCYHKRSAEIYQPMSKLAQQHDLKLNKQRLHTAVMQTATAGQKQQAQRKHLQTMRLGFDCLQQDLFNTTQYLPVPSVPNKWAKASFEEFCRYAADIKKLSLPRQIDWQAYYQQGQQRFKRVSALDLIRFAFRRPTEVWLCLDRALYLQEHGYQVELGTFCSAKSSPRNILIKAKC